MTHLGYEVYLPVFAKLQKSMTNKKYDASVVVGRYHVSKLTRGHYDVIQQAANEGRRLIIFVGVSPVMDNIRNPLDFQTREMMLRASLSAYNPIILPISDVCNDQLWSSILDKKIKEIVPFGSVQLFGGRDSFLHHYHGIYKEKNSTMIDEVVGISGSNNRENIRANPLESEAFRAGVIYGKANMYPTVHPTVDIAVWKEHENKIHVLLGRKPNEKLFRFPGGFVDPADASYEFAALRELKEETNIEPEHVAFPKFVCSHQVDDWRYQKDRNKIVTTLFSVKYDFPESTVEAGDDLAEVKWFDVDKVIADDLEPVHRPLWSKFKMNMPWHKL